MFYILYFDDKVSQRKVIKNHKEEKNTILYLQKKSTYKPTCGVQTRVQESTVYLYRNCLPIPKSHENILVEAFRSLNFIKSTATLGDISC